MRLILTVPLNLIGINSCLQQMSHLYSGATRLCLSQHFDQSDENDQTPGHCVYISTLYSGSVVSHSLSVSVLTNRSENRSDLSESKYLARKPNSALLSASFEVRSESFPDDVLFSYYRGLDTIKPFYQIGRLKCEQSPGARATPSCNRQGIKPVIYVLVGGSVAPAAPVPGPLELHCASARVSSCWVLNPAKVNCWSVKTAVRELRPVEGEGESSPEVISPHDCERVNCSPLPAQGSRVLED
ncbi:hypothetical protein J6590_032272 [Homalodisca vitripennis]|nr:hypothetical protein J6590_032272 [Homalodisca vitripennis]